ncbi:agmatinase [Lichenicoccus roseus]|nr:agmatinase [Lichenicoccus roseus]
MSRWRRPAYPAYRPPMTGIPTFATPPSFLGLQRNDRAAAYTVAGIPLDIGVTNRPGARFGAQAIRQASRMLVDGAHPHSWIDPAALPVADIGDFEIALGDLAGSLALIEQQAAVCTHLLALGGEHGITLPLLRALNRREAAPGLVHFDAHVDTWPDSFGQAYGHGSPFFHAIRENLVDPHRMIQVGIRSPVQREVWDWTLAQGVTILTAQDVHELGPAMVAERIRIVTGNGPTYLSFDIDALDPAFAPGTGTPEIGGLASWQVQAILRRLQGLRFVGMDVVEVAPPYDVSEITALAAATVVWEYLSLVAR